MANKLELTWYGKEDAIKVEPRLLIHDSAKDYGEAETENMLIHGDNLLALKALEKDYTGQVKCVYIDPPFNTGQAFENYDDNLEMSIWLSLMRSRLQIIYKLMKNEGTLFVHIDDENLAYITVLLDEIDSGLDVDSLKIVGENVTEYQKNSNCGVLLITHYRRLLEYIKPEYVHIMMNGRIVKSGDFSLVDYIEKNGYEKIEKKKIELGTCAVRELTKNE